MKINNRFGGRVLSFVLCLVLLVCLLPVQQAEAKDYPKLLLECAYNALPETVRNNPNITKKTYTVNGEKLYCLENYDFKEVTPVKEGFEACKNPWKYVGEVSAKNCTIIDMSTAEQVTGYDTFEVYNAVFHNYRCTICGEYTHTHTYVNGHCTGCGWECEACAFEHITNCSGWKCSVCGRTGSGNHVYKNQFCTICGARCPECNSGTAIIEGTTCNTCGYQHASHDSFCPTLNCSYCYGYNETEGKAIYCDAAGTKEHDYSKGYCRNCSALCPDCHGTDGKITLIVGDTCSKCGLLHCHDIGGNHNYKQGKCELCGENCPTCKNTASEIEAGSSCPTCGLDHPTHSTFCSEKKCPVCGEPGTAEHYYLNGDCEYCNKVCTTCENDITKIAEGESCSTCHKYHTPHISLCPSQTCACGATGTGEHFYVDGVCFVGHHNCTTCNADAKNISAGSKCTECDLEHSAHDTICSGEKCSVCGVDGTADHNYVNGFCSCCHAVCPDCNATVGYGETCDTCGLTHSHSWNGEYCTTCHNKHTHLLCCTCCGEYDHDCTYNYTAGTTNTTGDTIYACCADDNCPYETSKDYIAKLVISADNTTKYTGDPVKVTVKSSDEDFESFKSDNITIHYAGVYPTVYAASTEAPTDAGTYRAYVQFIGTDGKTATASVDYKITGTTDKTPIAEAIAAVNESFKGAGDGRITGLDSSKSYVYMVTNGPLLDVPENSTQITGLTYGKYFIRYRNTENTGYTKSSWVYVGFESSLTVKFNVSGEVWTQEGNLGYGEYISLPSNPTLEGYQFVEWNTKPDGTGDTLTPLTQVTEEMVYNSTDYVITYYAIFTDVAITGTVTNTDKGKVKLTGEGLPFVNDGEIIALNVTVDGSDIAGVEYAIEFNNEAFELVAGGTVEDPENLVGMRTEVNNDLHTTTLYVDAIIAGNGGSKELTADKRFADGTTIGTFYFKAKAAKEFGECDFNITGTIATEWEIAGQKANATLAKTVSPGVIVAPAYSVELVSDYVSGKALVLVYTDAENCSFTYNGMLLTAVNDKDTKTGAKYEFLATNGIVHGTHNSAKLYAIVTDNSSAAKLTVTGVDELVSINLKTNNLYSSVRFGMINDTQTYQYDVNDSSGTTDLYDAVAAMGVYNINETYFELDNSTGHYTFEDVILKADVNRDKKVDTKDVAGCLNNYCNPSV